MNLSDNATHLFALIAVLAAGVCLVIFGHVSPDGVIAATMTLAGSLFGYKFGSSGGSSNGNSTPTQ